MSYSNEEKVEDYLTIDIDSSFSSRIIEWAESVDKYIDNYTGKSFSEISESRYFDGSGSRELDVDDFVSISEVLILNYEDDDTMYALSEGKGNDYVTFPYNETPKYRLILTPASTIGGWLKGDRRIKITATWGHQSSIPSDIVLAATMLLAGIIEKGLKGGTVKSESLGDYSVTFKDLDDISSTMGVKDILSHYKIYEL